MSPFIDCNCGIRRSLRAGGRGRRDAARQTGQQGRGSTRRDDRPRFTDDGKTRFARARERPSPTAGRHPPASSKPRWAASAYLELLFEQADTSLTVSRLLLICLILGLAGTGAGAALGVHLALIPVLALLMAALPFFWLTLRRRRRLKAFAVQLPDALEMLARSLRAGQSLASGFQRGGHRDERADRHGIRPRL